MKAFAEIGYEGNLSYEASLFVNSVPVDLQKESAKYMASVGKHLRAYSKNEPFYLCQLRTHSFQKMFT